MDKIKAENALKGIPEKSIETAIKILAELVINPINHEFENVDYYSIEMRLKNNIDGLSSGIVKSILIGLYWMGEFQELIGQMKGPSEFWEIRGHYQNNKEEKL